MEKYKKQFLNGFNNRGFLLMKNESEVELPWWLEDIWVLSYNNKPDENLFFNFMNDLSWENGPKIVSKIYLSSSKMENYADVKDVLLEFDMLKGDFQKKLDNFWLRFDSLE